MREFFSDCLSKIVDFKTVTETVDEYGRPVVSEVTTYADQPIQFWIDSVDESNTNDKFVNQETGRAIVDSALTIDNTMFFTDGESIKRYVVGVDDIAALGSIKVVKWRRERG